MEFMCLITVKHRNKTFNNFMGLQRHHQVTSGNHKGQLHLKCLQPVFCVIALIQNWIQIFQWYQDINFPMIPRYKLFNKFKGPWPKSLEDTLTATLWRSFNTFSIALYRLCNVDDEKLSWRDSNFSSLLL